MTNSTLELIRRNISDSKAYEQIFLAVRQRARVTAIVLGSFLIISLIAIVFAFLQMTVADNAAAELALLKNELRVAKAEAEKQASVAIETKMIAEEAAKLTQEQLDACRKSKK